MVEALGAGCSRLRVGDRVGALTVWGANAELRLRAGEVRRGGTRGSRSGRSRERRLPVHDRLPDAAPDGESGARRDGARARCGGRVGTAALELGGSRGCDSTGPARRETAAVERLGAVAIDYQNEDFLARVRELTGGEGVESCSMASAARWRCARSEGCARQPGQGDPGGRLVTMGSYNTMENGHKSWRGWLNGGRRLSLAVLWGTLSPRTGGHGLSGPNTASRPPGLVPRRTSRRCSSCCARTRSTRSSRSACRCPRPVARTTARELGVEREARPGAVGLGRPDGARRPHEPSRESRARWTGSAPRVRYLRSRTTA